MLVDEHADTDAHEVEAVEKVLRLSDHVGMDLGRALLHLHDAATHRLHHVHVTIADVNERLGETVQSNTNSCR